MNSIASLNQVSHYFHSKKVLDNISISFTEHKVSALLGFSGSGKSTILKMVNGMIQPDEGNISVFGNAFDYKHSETTRLKIGYAVQSVGLFPHLTVGQNISILGDITQQPKEEITKRIETLIDIVRLPKNYLNKFPSELSGGEQQRVGLCRAFFLKPPLILMDEPFASLDYKTRAGIYEHLISIQKIENSSIIIVTHQLEEAIHLCDDFYWIQNGSVYKQGNKDSLKNLQYEFKEQFI